jgi:hypothetical protein
MPPHQPSAQMHNTDEEDVIDMPVNVLIAKMNVKKSSTLDLNNFPARFHTHRKYGIIIPKVVLIPNPQKHISIEIAKFQIYLQ